MASVGQVITGGVTQHGDTRIFSIRVLYTELASGRFKDFWRD
jgi:hypothetical protein